MVSVDSLWISIISEVFIFAALKVPVSFPCGSEGKCLPAMQETRVWSLGWEDPLATHSSTLAWKIPFTEKPGRLQPMGSQRIRHYWATSCHFKVPRASQVALMVKILPVQSKGQEDPLEKEIATHSRIFAWEIPWTRNLVAYCPWGCRESRYDWATEQQWSLDHSLVSLPPKCPLFKYSSMLTAAE